MKQKWLIIGGLFLLLASANVSADNVVQMNLVKSKVDSTGVQLTANSRITFEGDQMIFHSADGTVFLPFSMDELRWISFSAGTDGITLMTNEGNFRRASFKGNNLVLKGFDGEKCNISVYGIEGVQKFKQSGVTQSQVALPGELLSGDYIIKVNKYVFKARKQ